MNPHLKAPAQRPAARLRQTGKIVGNVAENSGGVHCLKYGLTLHNVLRVRGFTVEGEPIEFGGEALDAPGLDLLALVIGSEGMLAVTTEVTVKLVPRPQVLNPGKAIPTLQRCAEYGKQVFRAGQAQPFADLPRF